tara:strand:- start:772 stop:954 length:183 start_codon:yes stop_codon:yes gene_type:complete
MIRETLTAQELSSLSFEQLDAVIDYYGELEYLTGDSYLIEREDVRAFRANILELAWSDFS